MLPLVGCGLIELADVADDLVHVDGRERASVRAGFDARDAQQRVERLEHALDLLARIRSGPRGWGRSAFATLSSRLRKRVSGPRRSCATLSPTWRIPSSRLSIWSSIAFMFAASSSCSSLLPVTGARRLRSPAMIWRVVRFKSASAPLRAHAHQQPADQRERRA